MSVRGGIDRPLRVHVTGVHIWATLCRFDEFEHLGSYSGPFIPCERRLSISGILEIQGRGLWTGFLI